MHKFLPLIAFIFAMHCGGNVAIETTQETAQAATSTYNILVLELFKTGTSPTWPAFGLSDPFATAVKRLSYDGVAGSHLHPIAIQYNILPPFSATPAQVGCGGPDELHSIMQFAVTHAIQMGVNFAPYKHIWLAADSLHSFLPECSTAYAGKGGRNFGYAGLTDNAFGMLWFVEPNNAVNAIHEFGHGYGPAGYSHELLLNCPHVGYVESVNTPNCVRYELAPNGLPSFFAALGANAAGGGLNDPLFNESTWYKYNFGWIGPELMFTVQPNATGGVLLNKMDGTSIVSAALVKVVRPDGRFFLFERRLHAPVGPSNAEAPGVYGWLVEPSLNALEVAVIAISNGGSGFYNHIHPVAPANGTAAQIEPGLQVKDNYPQAGFFTVSCNKAPGSTCP